MSMVVDFFTALKYGNSLGNPTEWKMAQISSTVVLGLVTLILKYVAPDVVLDKETTDAVVSAIIGVMVLINVYLTKATSKKI